MIFMGPDPRESDVVAQERNEQSRLRDAEDAGHWRRIGGIPFDDRDVPTEDEL